MTIRTIVYILIGLLGFEAVSAQELKDSVKIHFQTGKTHLDLELGNNRQVLENITNKFQSNVNDSIYYRLQKVLVVGGASPEGSVTLNKQLSEKRAETLFNYLAKYRNFPDSLRYFTFLGCDWKGLYRLAKADLNLPEREETLAFLREIMTNPTEADVRKLRSFKNGVPYSYMFRNLFPALRVSSMYLWYSEVTLSPSITHTSLRKDIQMDVPTLVVPQRIVSTPEESKKVSFCWALKTNLLYDAVLVPNIGAEFYIGKDWSAGTNWMYAWWKNDRNNKYWRVYGGDIYARKWFGKKAEEKPLTGHHAGVYAQVLTYDFCTGNRGYMGGTPGGNFWNKLSWAAGIEYGYSHPIARKLNLDFTIGIGYLQGEYHEYIPMDDCYVWQATKKRKWFGPTKAEISLVWLLGHDNYNQRKGGKR